MKKSNKQDLPTLVFQISIGLKDNLLPQEWLTDFGSELQKFEIPGFNTSFIPVPNHDSNETKISLIYPINNSLVSEKDFLDLLTKNGYVPPRILEQIQSEINKQ